MIRTVALSVFAFLITVPIGAQTIDGKVFYDANGDGAHAAGEAGAPRVVVSAFDGTGTLVSQTASCDFVAVSLPANPPTVPVAINIPACAATEMGDYSLSGLAAATDYRLELTWADAFLFEGAQGATSVAFAASGATGVDFGVLHPEDYCQDDPRIIAGCFVFPPVPWSAAATDPLVVSWPYNSRFTSAADAEIHPHADDLDYGDVGHLLGVATHRSTKRVFFSAIATPLWPAGGAGIGGIYSADYSGIGNSYVGGSVGLFLDLAAVVDLTAQNPVTAGVLDRFGEFGLGGIDFSADDQVLWAVNMGGGELIRIPVGDPPVTPAASAITEITPTGHGCTNGSFRPGAVATHRGKVFLGGVCDAASGSTADLRLVVLEYDGATFTNRLSASLGFLVNSIFPQPASINMFPWSGIDDVAEPQPFLTNLAFEEDGSLVLGVMPRIMYTTFAQTAGFMVRAQRSATGDFVLESAGGTGPYSTAARTGWSGAGFDPSNPNAGEGPGGSWFYEQGMSYGSTVAQTHPVLFSAGITVVPGTGEVAAGYTDPLSINSFGVRYFDAQNGRTVAGLQFGGLKVALVTDVDTICEQSPLEIGNRIWCDADADGIQDPGSAEGGIPGVDVVLTCGADNPVTATTDAFGQYLFTDALYATANGGDPLPRETACTLRIALTGGNATAINGSCGSLALSPQDNGGVDDGAELRDSDGSLVSGQVEIPLNTGKNGEHDHRYDQGFKSPDMGDAPDTYGTTVGAGGPQHVLTAGYSLGSTVDGELDGQPSVGAIGDGADEDGVVFAGGMAMALGCTTGNNLTVTLTNSAGVSGADLDGWIDFNGDGDFDHPAEHLFGGISQSLSSGSNALTYDVPCDAVSQAVSYARFRLSSAGSLTPLGAAADGEIEDYAFQIKGLDFGDAPDTYGTTLAANGPRHAVVPGYSLGASEDTESDGQPSVGAVGDGVDEDGVVFGGGMAMAPACSTDNGLTVTLVNSAGISGASLDAWIDFNGDGDFDHPAEHLFGGTSRTLAAGANAATYDVPCEAVAQATSYARFRLSSTGGLTPVGAATDGEIEDYVLQIKGIDLGDAPDTYGTTIAANGPRHGIVSGYSLGATEDAEFDGQPSVGADGDGADEDGIAFAGGMAMAAACDDDNALTATLSNSAGVRAALLDAWIDWNGDGNFDHPAEHLFGGTSQPLANGANALTFNVPCDAVAQATGYARFRLSSVGSLTPLGSAADGEVEDYPFTLKGVDLGDAPDSYGTTVAADGPRHVLVGGFSLGPLEDGESDGQPSAGADGDGADEDGIAFADGMAMAVSCSTDNALTANLTNSAGISPALLDVWIDFNGDGDFDHPAEHLFGGTSEGLSSGANALTFDVPCNAVVQSSSYARFRLSSAGSLSPTGAAADGEVEDYLVQVKGADLGDAPDTYGTTVAANGALHGVVPGYSLGSTEDSETDGQPSVGADGDGVDEDGVAFAGGMAMAGACSTDNGLTVDLLNSAGLSGALLDAWIDWNGDGDFDHPAEHLFGGTSQALAEGANALSYDVPCMAVPQAVSYGRFRLSSGGALAPTGSTGDGEVEDYTFQVKGVDFGDAPDTYGTTQGANGPAHTIVPGFALGNGEDSESDGQPTAGADGDGADEDGIVFAKGMAMAAACEASILDASLTNSSTISTAFLDAWIDWNGDGDFDHPAEHLFGGTSAGLVTGANSLPFDVPCDLEAGNSYARFRLSSTGGLTPTDTAAPAPDGEVEDYTFLLKGLDWGDAPAPYATLLANDGPRHAVLPVDNPTLGTLVDEEVDGQPDAAHGGDDNGGVDDEDGVVLPAMVVPSSTIDVVIEAANGAVLNGWIDWNGNGVFGDLANEAVAIDVALAAGSTTLAVDVPAVTVVGPVCARFRYSSQAGLAPTGPAPDGEIEDYGLELLPEDVMIGVAKEATDVLDNGDGSWLITYEIQIENFGNVPLESVQVSSDLSVAFAEAVSFAVESLVASANLTANGAFDGSGDTDLLAGLDTLAIGELGSLELIVRLVPGDFAGPYVCSATGAGTSPQGTTVTDKSQDGPSPDPDGNDNPTDNEEPTEVTLDLGSLLEIPALGPMGLAMLGLLLAFAAGRILRLKQST
ncbi:MAG: GEVED domain-containing protein [Acidobacteriota bacterium]